MGKNKLVPMEPTLEMMEAGAEGCGQDLDRDEARGRAFVAYKAMIAAAPAVQGEPVAWQLRTPEGRVILNKELPAWAEGVDGYKITPLYAAPQPAEQQPIKSSLALDAAAHLTNWLDMGLCDCEGGHTCGYNDVKRTRDALLVAAELKPSVDDSPTPVPDELFTAEFNTWWEQHGQFCRAGGGEYERTFAFEAWRYLYTQLMSLRTALAEQQPAPDVAGLVEALEAITSWVSHPAAAVACKALAAHRKQQENDHD